jgi:dTDP-glucose 4,6-dehydratase
MKVLLTGAGGFVGHHAIPYLINNTEWELVLTDSFKHLGTSARLRESLKNISEKDQKRIKVITHDLTTPIDKITAKEFGNIDSIINYASLSDVDDSIATPIPFVQNNINLALNMFEYARNLDNLKTFIQISTDEVYGPLLSESLHSEGEPFNPSNPYSASKVGQEAIANAYWKTYDLPIVITNSMNMFGERQYEKSFIPKIILYLLNNKTIPVHVKYLNGEMKTSSRSYMYVQNQVDGIKFLVEYFQNAAQIPSEGLTHIERFNVCGETVTHNDDLVFKIANILNIKTENLIEYIDPTNTRPGLDIKYGLNTKKINDLGWKEFISLDEGLEKTVNWSKNNPIWL